MKRGSLFAPLGLLLLIIAAGAWYLMSPGSAGSGQERPIKVTISPY